MPKKEHYSIKLKKEIKYLIDQNNKLYEAIWWAKTKVLGSEPFVRPFSSLRGHEESIPLHDPDRLRQLILDLPLE